jgi:hypothetical protein
MPSHFLRPRGFHGSTYRCRVASERLDALNQEILTELQVRGIAVPSQTVLRGRFAIRVCITNHRSELSDFDALVEAVPCSRLAKKS